jgi:mono/diheme cytochrome c family protein
MKTRPLTLALLGVLLIPVLAFRFGGWAVVTVDDLPEYLVAGKPAAVSFVVRQHGITLLDGLKPTITLKSGDTETSMPANWANERGRYLAMVTAPRAGEWTIKIRSGFMNVERTLLPMRAIAAGAAAPKALADAERGHQLFVAKDCVSCHTRGGEGTEGYKFGPDLTGKRYVGDYVAKFLADPESSPLSRATAITPNSVRMPNLNLNEREITSLVAFLNSERPVLGSTTPR